MPAPDFVAVGHVTLDRIGDAVRPGGAALYAAITADRLGLEAALLTSHADDFPLATLPPRIEVVSLAAPATTVFEHGAGPAGRALRVRSTARPLAAADLPGDWRGASLVLLAPVLDEVDPRLATAFDDATVAAAIQGWLRAAGRDGTVRPRPWPSPKFLLDHVQAIFLSAEDVRGVEAEVVEWMQRVPVGAVTAGAAGALLYVNGERYEVRPLAVREVDATGAGDVFAAAFLAEYARHGDPWMAAEAAACAGALMVTGAGWSAVPDRAALEAALADYRSGA